MKQILCFGDSNTYGLIPGQSDRYSETIRWTGLLEESLKKYDYKIIEEGLCGRTTIFEDPLRAGRKGTEQLPIILETHKPVELVVLMLGTNDCKKLYAANEQIIGKGIRKLILQIKDMLPNSKILLVSPIYLGKGVGEKGYDLEFDENSVRISHKLPNTYYDIAKKEGVYYIAASDYASPSSKDREHLDEEEHAKLAKALLEKITTDVLYKN